MLVGAYNYISTTQSVYFHEPPKLKDYLVHILWYHFMKTFGAAPHSDQQGWQSPANDLPVNRQLWLL